MLTGSRRLTCSGENQLENTDTDKQTGAELLKAVYEQHWLHARHIENERLWFTNIFGVITAGLLAVLFTSGGHSVPNVFAICVGGTILILSLAGYWLCVTWRAPFIEHTTLANKIFKNIELQQYVPYISPAYRKMKVGWVSAHELFLYLYSFMAGVSLFIVLYVGLEWCHWWVSFIPIIILCSLWRGLLRRREVAYRKDMDVTER